MPPAAVARKPQHLAGDNPGHHLLEHECVLGGEGPDDGVLGSPTTDVDALLAAYGSVSEALAPNLPAMTLIGVSRLAYPELGGDRGNRSTLARLLDEPFRVTTILPMSTTQLTFCRIE